MAAEGDIAAAAELYLESIEVLESCGTPFDVAVSRMEYASFCIESIVDLKEAASHLDRARKTFDRIGAEYEAGHAYLLAAKLEMVCDHPTGEARHHLETAMGLLERVGGEEDHEAVAEVHRDIDRLLEETAASGRNDLAVLNEVVAKIQAEADPGEKTRALEKALEERLGADRVALFTMEEAGLGVAPASGLRGGDTEPVETIVEILGAAQLREAKAGRLHFAVAGSALRRRRGPGGGSRVRGVLAARLRRRTDRRRLH